jgi:hypothetical protein
MFRTIRIPLAAFLVLVAVGGVAFASRNSTGTYSLPTGNPVVPGTTISTTWANNTLSDISTELTNSLDRSGRGAMLAPLQHSSGTVTSPSLTFSSEPGSGIYRAGTNDVRMSVNQTDAQKWAPGASTFPGTLAVTGATTLSGLLSANVGLISVAALPTSGTVLPGVNYLSTVNLGGTSGQDYPLAGVRTGTNLAGNGIGLTTRARLISTGNSWTNVALGLTFDVDSTESAGGGIWFANGKTFFGSNPASPKTSIDWGTGALTIGGTGTAISASYAATFNFAFGVLTGGTCATSAQTLTGVTVGGTCTVSADGNISPNIVDCFVSASNTVTIRACPLSSNTFNAGNFRVRVFQP